MNEFTETISGAEAKLKQSRCVVLELVKLGLIDARRMFSGRLRLKAGDIDILVNRCGGKYTIDAFAKKIGFNRQTVTRWVEEGTLPDRRIVREDGSRIGRLFFRDEDEEKLFISSSSRFHQVDSRST